MAEQAKSIVVVLSEIYGINAHIQVVCRCLERHGRTALAPDFLAGRCFSYGESAAAYAYFKEQIGFDYALALLEPQLVAWRQQYQGVYLLGYSVGATLAWRCSQAGLADGMVGFYGSRIRDYLQTPPQCPALLLFAEQEAALDVGALVPQLTAMRQVEAQVFAAAHGFADRYSPHYQPAAAKQAMRNILLFQQRLRKK